MFFFFVEFRMFLARYQMRCRSLRITLLGNGAERNGREGKGRERNGKEGKGMEGKRIHPSFLLRLGCVDAERGSICPVRCVFLLFFFLSFFLSLSRFSLSSLSLCYYITYPPLNPPNDAAKNVCVRDGWKMMCPMVETVIIQGVRKYPHQRDYGSPNYPLGNGW